MIATFGYDCGVVYDVVVCIICMSVDCVVMIEWCVALFGLLVVCCRVWFEVCCVCDMLLYGIVV